jgi:arylformamidase
MKNQMTNNWIFLSYVLSDKLSGYGNGKRIQNQKIRSIERGDTSNNTELAFPSHFGTHIDFPLHFTQHGKAGESYLPSEFIYHQIQLIEIEMISRENKMIGPEDFKNIALNPHTEFLIIKTGYTTIRNEDMYWNNNPGFTPDLASFLKSKMPSIRALGFDSISLSGYQHRELGRVAHKKFLSDEHILIVEDMCLNKIDAHSKITQLILAPLLFEQCDGTPVTVFAKIENEN